MSFKKEVSKCKCCKEEKLIVNRTRWLCDDCNKERLGSNKKVNKGLKGSNLISQGKGMKRMTKKRSTIEDRYRETQNEIWEERDHCCDECGRPDRLSFSHLLSRRRYPELIDCKENIVLHCMSFDGDIGCHERWEAGDETMKTFEKLTNIVKELECKNT